MSPLLRAFSGALVRWLMVFAGAHGVELGSDDAEAIINALLIAIPILWSIIQKWQAQQKIETAERCE